MAVRGVDVLVYVNLGDDETPDWQPVAGQRGATLTEEVETMDLTNKSSPEGTREEEPTLYAWSLSCDGVYIKDDEALQALKQTIRQRGKVKVRLQEQGQFTEEGLAIVLSLERDFPYDDVSTYTMELQGVGPLTTVTE